MVLQGSASALATVQLPTPARFAHSGSGCPLSAWRRWTAYFKRFAAAANYSQLAPPDQISHLLIHAGEFISDLYDAHIAASIKVTDGYAAALQMIENHFSAQLNASQARFEFFNENQGSRDLDKFIQDIKDKASECRFCAGCKDSLVSTVFINGVNDRKLRRHLISINNLDKPNELLLKAICFTSTREIESKISERASTAAGAANSAPDITAHQVSSRPRHNGGAARPRANGAPSPIASARPRKPICKLGCFSHPGGRCRAPAAQCFTCKKKGHFSNVCRSISSIENTVGVESSASDEEHVDDICLSSISIHELDGGNKHHDTADTWWEEILLGNRSQPVRFKLDSGAQCNVLPFRVFSKIADRPTLSGTTQKVVSYSSHSMRVEGTCTLPIRLRSKGTLHHARFFVIKTDAPPLLGLPDCRTLNLIRRVDFLSRSEGSNTIIAEFRDVFDVSRLGRLNAMQSIIVPDPPAPKTFPPRRVPMRFKDAVREQLKTMVTAGVLEPTTKTTRFVLPVVTVLKPNGSIRLCIDPRYINPHIQRMKFPMPKAEQIFANLAGARYFTVVDADSAFYQLPLDNESSDLCTISTEFGNYRFKRLPFGIVDASERFCEVMHRLFSGLDNVINCVDDFLIYGRSQEEHDLKLRAFLTRCREVGLRLKPDKLQFAQSSVRFLGHTINHEGVGILEERVKAIRQIKPPTSPSETRRFLGIINYLQKFIPNAAELTAPLRALTRSDPEDFRWGQQAQTAFDQLKSIISKAPVLRHIDTKKPLTISADSSSYGMGAVLLQEGRPIAYTSASLSPTQQRYAQLEKELLAVVFACEQFRFYILGTSVNIESDHRPLVSIVKKDISTLSPRLQKMMLRLLRYSFQLKYVPGKEMFIADALSRAPTDSCFETPEMENDKEQVLCAVTMSPSRQIELIHSSQADPAVAAACKLTAEGWPSHKHRVPVEAKTYWQYKTELHIQEGLLYRSNRLVIPMSERQSVLSTLHAAHQGEERMLRMARNSVFWPGMTSDIRQTVENCNQCQLYRRANRKETLRPTPAPPHPWHTVGADFMHLRQKTFLVVVDYFSKDVFVKAMQLTTAAAVILAMKQMILIHGIPSKLVSDNGPPFGSLEFRSFCDELSISLQPISAGHSSGNGQIERTIQTVKATLSKAFDSNSCATEALLTLRTTPAEDGISPSQLSNGRIIRTKLPVDNSLLSSEPGPMWSRRRSLLRKRAETAEKYFNRTAADLPVLLRHQKVLVRKSCRQWEEGVVVEVLDNPRSYRVRLKSGIVVRRNRIDISPDKRRAQEQHNHREEESPTQTILLRGALRDTAAPQAVSNAQNAPTHNDPAAHSRSRPSRVSTRSGRIPILNSRFYNANYANS